ncbi:MAG: non-lysosomal glucosylceramidase [Actinobacteria bacterium]|nr:non-lysosomal glucosylceramidase [Actinomycetota bacterium]
MSAPARVADVSSYFADSHPVARFPLGGIGTGNVSVGSRGQLCDWEIFNRPGAGQTMPYSFFAISAQPRGAQRVSRVLEARHQPPFDLAGGFASADLAGLPRFANAELRSMYPYVWVRLLDDVLPFQVTLEAFTPFVPRDVEASSIPAAILRYEVRNTADVPLDVSIAGSLTNASGFTRFDSMGEVLCLGAPTNQVRSTDGRRGLYFANADLTPDSMHYGTLSLTTAEPSVTTKSHWFDGQWTDLAEEFWRDFRTDGRLSPAPVVPGVRCDLGERGTYGYIRRKEVVGSVAAHREIPAGGSHVFEFVLTWSFPNRLGTWLELDEQRAQLTTDWEDLPRARNHYAIRYPDAWDVVEDLDSRLAELERRTVAFRDALYSSSLPMAALEAAANNIATLRSPTCYRIEDGSFFGYEGVTDSYGTGAGNVTHVWNYAQTVSALFPSLELTMRRMEIGRTAADGFMSFRHLRSYQGLPWDMPICPDGQLGAVVRMLREWRTTGDEEFLAQAWPAAQRALEYVIRACYSSELGVLAGDLHNTYDIEFVGANPMSNVLFLAALRAAAELARAAGDQPAADRYRSLADETSGRVVSLLWNGEYLAQDRLGNLTRPYQMGDGCLTDQLLGQWLARLTGLGHLLPADLVRRALTSVFAYNFRPDAADDEQVQRTYAMPGEGGVVNCSWPRGGRPDYPFAFCDEVWTGTEYALASHLIAEGLVAEGLTVVQAVRDRYDGGKRNPWAEIEAGWHYTRAMASWGLISAYSGVDCDVPGRAIGFKPAGDAEAFGTIWSCGAGWGTYREDTSPGGGRRWELRVHEGDLDGFAVNGDGIVVGGRASGELAGGSR